MTSEHPNTTSSVKPSRAPAFVAGHDAGSLADINAFMNHKPQHRPTALPQNPWTVPSGSYTRPDGSVVYIEHPHQIRNTALNKSASSSMEVLTGGSNGASAQHGAKSGQ